jgi:outer membrane protein TolC
MAFTRTNRWLRLGPCAISLLVLTSAVCADPNELPAPTPRQSLPILKLEDAIYYALENNPGIVALRQQHNIAAAKIVIADTYPFNPVVENRIQGANGPASAAVDNHLPFEQVMIWEVELRRQSRYRRQGAAAALSRTDWEIAHQEQLLAVQVVRAYSGQLYRQEKLRLLEETLKLNQRQVEDTHRLVDKLGKLKVADRIAAEAEVSLTLIAIGEARKSLAEARQELFRALGIVDAAIDIEGALESSPLKWDAAMLSDLAVSRRADLQARQAALNEAYAAYRLAKANRFGNPSIGTAYLYDPTRITAIGAQINLPLAVFNTRRGEVYQSEEEYTQASLLARQTEINVRQDVALALARLEAAERQVAQFKTKVLPDLQRAVEDMDKLFQNGEIDAIKIIEVRRNLLKARDGYIDALWGVRQARADLLAATGEPILGLVVPSPK